VADLAGNGEARETCEKDVRASAARLLDQANEL